MKVTAKVTLWIVVTTLLTGITFSASARPHDEWPYPGRQFSIMHMGIGYLYHNGLFFRHKGGRFLVVAPPFGAIVPVLPFGCVSFTFGPGVVYYFLDGVYYRSVPDGYVVVPESEVEEYRLQKEISESKLSVERSTGTAVSGDNISGEFTINVPNGDGSYTPVRLKKSGNGYTGPQGEYYEGNPSVEQLKVLYGK